VICLLANKEQNRVSIKEIVDRVLKRVMDNMGWNDKSKYECLELVDVLINHMYNNKVQSIQYN